MTQSPAEIIGALFGVSAIAAAAGAVIFGNWAIQLPNDKKYEDLLKKYLKRSYGLLGYVLVAVAIMMVLCTK